MTLTCHRVRVTSARRRERGGEDEGSAMAKAMKSPTFIAQLCILLATKAYVTHD